MLVRRSPSHRNASTIQWGMTSAHLTRGIQRFSGRSRSPSTRTGETDGPAGTDMARTFDLGVQTTLRPPVPAGRGGGLRFGRQWSLDAPVEPRLDVLDRVGEEDGVVLARHVAEMRRQDGAGSGAERIVLAEGLAVGDVERGGRDRAVVQGAQQGAGVEERPARGVDEERVALLAADLRGADDPGAARRQFVVER